MSAIKRCYVGFFDRDANIELRVFYPEWEFRDADACSVGDEPDCPVNPDIRGKWNQEVREVFSHSRVRY